MNKRRRPSTSTPITLARAGLLALVLAGLCVSVSRTEAANPWIQIEGRHFTVLTNDSTETAKSIAWQFEQIRSLIQVLWPGSRTEADRPVSIVAVDGASAMRTFLPSSWKADYQPQSILYTGPDRFYIVLRSDLKSGDRDGLNPYSGAYASYLSFLLNGAARARLPLWVRDGTTALLANVTIRGSELEFGFTLQPYLRQLRARPRMRIRELIAADEQSAWWRDPERRFTMYGESWFLMHYLLFGQGKFPDAPNVAKFSALLTQGSSGSDAFEQAFGSPDSLEADFAKYMTLPTQKYFRLKPTVELQASYQARSLSPVELATATASFHIAGRRLQDAGFDLDEARRLDGGATIVKDVEGLFFSATEQPDRARAAFEAAATAGSNSYYSHFRAAAYLDSRVPDAAARKTALLNRAIELNDSFLPAQMTLATHQMQIGRVEAAVAAATRAAALVPGQFSPQILLARALAAASRPVEAIRQLNYALTVAQNANERQAGQQLLDRTIADAVTALPPMRQPIPLPAGAVRVGGAVPIPAQKKRVSAVYTDLATAARAQGAVTVDAIVGADGHVLQARIVKSIPLLDRAAIDAVEQWEFEPTIVGGRAVPVVIAVNLQFALP